MICAVRTLLASLAVVVSVQAGFEEMVAKAELIAHCRVTAGGTLSATVTAVETIKGKAPRKPFLVGGFNLHSWPPDRQEREAFREGEEYLLFLRGSDQVHAGFEIPKLVKTHVQQLVVDGLIKKEDLPKQRRYYERPLYASGYLVSSPTTGDFVIRDGQIQGDWFEPDNPRRHAWVPAPMAFALIQGLTAESNRAARGVLARQLTKDLVSEITQADNPEMHNRIARFRWLMCAQAAYGSPDMQGLIELAVAQDTPTMRLFAARALRSLPESRATLGLITPLLNAVESDVQAEAADSLVAGDFTPIAGAMLVEALPTSRIESGRAAMIRAVTHFKFDSDTLLDFIRAEQLNAGIIDALQAHFRATPNPEARTRFLREAARASAQSAHLFIDLLFADDSPAARAVLRSKLMSPAIAAESRVEWLRRYYQQHGVDETTFGQALEVLQKQRGRGQKASEQVLALRMLRILSASEPAIGRLQAFDLVDCVELMLQLRPKHALNKPALLYLLREHAADPQVMACTLLLPDAEVLFALSNPPSTEGIEARLIVQKAQELLAAESASTRRRIAVWMRLIELAPEDGSRGIFWSCLARDALADSASAAGILGPAMRSLISRGTKDTAQALALMQAVGIQFTEKERAAFDRSQSPNRDWPTIFAAHK